MKNKLKTYLLWLMPAFYLLASAFLFSQGLSNLSKSQNLILGTILLLYSLFRFYRAFKSIRTDEKEVDD
ncbi:MAG: hypothetical protein FD166_1691 [Bacteroidetes bacterium]|nr:MAG: hypothetical protein FD166_1691 [Bacteroidota bacterium]